MSRRHSSTPRSISLSFPIQLPVLRPPRLAKRTSRADTTIITSTCSSLDPKTMVPIRNHRRSNSIDLPDVENLTPIPSIRSRRKTDTIPLPLSPRAMNVGMSADSLCRGVDVPTFGSKGRDRRSKSKKRAKMQDTAYMHLEHDPEIAPIQSPSLTQLCASPRGAALELSPEEDLPVLIVSSQNDDLHISEGIPDHGELIYLEPHFDDPIEDDFASQYEEMIVRAARSRAQHRERMARRWESLCNARLRLLKEQQAIQHMILAEMSAAVTPPPVSQPTFFNVFGASMSSLDAASSPPSPAESFGAPLARMSSPSPYSSYGETVDLAGVALVEHRDQTLGGAGSSDSRPLVDRIIESMNDFGYDEICVDGLSETECRKLRTESRKRRRLDRQRVFELGVLLELKRRQLGRSRSSSSSSSSSSSDSCSEPPTPPLSPLAVQSVDHLVAKILLKRHETSQKPCTSSVATRAAFEARGCSSLRRGVETSVPVTRARGRSRSTKSAFSNLISLSGGVFGLGSPAWLKEKERLTARDRE